MYTIMMATRSNPMLKITHYLGRTQDKVHDTLTLPFELRRKGRLRIFSDSGAEVALCLQHGSWLAEGDRLKSECGRVFGVRAGLEPVVTAHAPDWPSFARACYHLGNRHAGLELGPLWLRFAPDHALERQAKQLGLRLERGRAAFHPEGRAPDEEEDEHP